MVEIGMTIGLGSYWLFTNRRLVHALMRRVTRFGRRSRARSAVPAAPDRLPDQGALSAVSLSKFRVVSVVALGQTAIVACRPCDRPGRSWRAQLPRLLHLPWGRRRRSSRALSPHGLRTTDHTLVLRVGGDAEAAGAWALLDQWREAGTVLWLRPTSQPSTVKLSDDGQSTLQAMLSAD
jgi:hypothetical protein